MTPGTSLMTTSEPHTILIVEDDAKIADMVANYLHMHGFTTRIVGDGVDAVTALRHATPDTFPALVLLDLMLPGLDGIAVCQAVRAFSAVPIIMVTARVDEIDRLLGLETGADDYICKPFSPREVVARIKALLRRSQGRMVQGTATISPEPAGAPPQFVVDDGGQRILSRHHNQVQALNLTPLEFRLFKLLLSRPGHVFARARLLDAVHQDFRDVSDRAVDSHIKNLRRKIDLVRPDLTASGSGITSVYGVGYRFEVLV